MNIFTSRILDNIILKILMYIDFPEDRYTETIENRKLKEELNEFKSARYLELVEENKKIKLEIEELQKEKIAKLEHENKILKLELTKTNELVVANKENSLQTIEYKNKMKPEIFNPIESDSFRYTNGYLKLYKDGYMTKTLQVSATELFSFLQNLIPEAEISISSINEVRLIIRDNDNTYIDAKPIFLNEKTFVKPIHVWVNESIAKRTIKKWSWDSYEENKAIF
ncbi:hypothetical protein MOK21_10920 [Lysinibacillus sp. BPa_S21]|nr:hypothetical protein [Lysinibacillus sp. BPa_S21]